jgi:hypothetical protein
MASWSLLIASLIDINPELANQDARICRIPVSLMLQMIEALI